MNKLFLLLLFCCMSTLVSEGLQAQGTSCATTQVLCDPNTSFDLGTTGTTESGPNYDCWSSAQDGPAWYTLAIGTSGDISITLETTPCLDVDYSLWGPFSSPTGNCGNLTAANNADCSFNGGCNNETIDLIGAVAGDFYVLVITNYSGMNASVSLTQMGGAGELGGPLAFGTNDFLSTDANAILATNPLISDPNVTGAVFSGPGIIDATTGEFSPAVAGVGTHTITLTATSFGCTVTTTTDIVVSLPPCDISLDNVIALDEICLGDNNGSITITASSTETIEYSIDGGTSFFPGSAYPGLAPGSYDVIVQDVGDPTCQAGPMTVTIEPGITVAPPTTTGETVACGGTIATGLTASCPPAPSPPATIFDATAADLLVTVCFDITHQYFSDMSTFTLIGPGGASAFLYNAPDGCCDAGSGSVSGLCFSTTSTTNTYDHLSTAGDAGTYDLQGPLSTLNGEDITAPGWSVQVYDCFGSDTGSLNAVSIDFTVNGVSTSYAVNGNIPINDNACDPSSASTLIVPPSAPVITWWNASNGGTQQSIDDANPFDPTGFTAEEGAVDLNTAGNYTFYAQCEFGGCVSTRTAALLTVESCCEFTATCATVTDLGDYDCTQLGNIPAAPTTEATVEAAPYNMTIGDSPCGTIVVLSADDITAYDVCTTGGQTITRTVTVIDDLNGNGALDLGEESQDCTYTFDIVEDTTPPVAPAPPVDVSVQCPSDVPAPVDLTANDACNGDITVSPAAVITPGTCDNQFTMVRTWTFSDGCGNTSSVAQTINVNDNTPPVPPAAPADVNVQCASDVPAPVDLTAADNCDGDITVSPAAAITPGSCDNQFTMVRTWTFSDGCGNTSSVAQTINVNDNTPPVPPAAPADVNVQCASDVPAPVDLTAADNCDGDITVSPTAVITPGTCDNQFTMVRTWTFSDGCGNTSSVAQTINVNDITAPVAPAPPADVNVQCASDIPAPVDLTAVDACDGDITVSPTAVITPGTCDNQFTMVRTWTFIGGCGQESSVSQTIDVNDTTAPVAPAAPADLNIQCESDVPAPVDLTAVDNCDGDITVSPTAVITPGTCDNQFTMVRTWTFVDGCGNPSSVSQTINVDDTTPPVITCPADIIVACGEDATAANTGTATALDACDAAPVVTSTDAINPVSGGYTITRTWTAIDECGNTSTCDQTINVTICGFEIADPCACVNNASVIDLDAGTGGGDGQFSELVAVGGPGATPIPEIPNTTFVVTALTGGVDTGLDLPLPDPITGIVPQTPGNLIPTDGTTLLEYNAVTGLYELPFYHYETAGYCITVEQRLDTGAGIIVVDEFEICNACIYPVPSFEPALADEYCPNEFPIILGGTDASGLGADEVTFTIDGTPATALDVTLANGTHTVVMTWNGAGDANNGISPDGGVTPAEPGCIQMVQKVINVDSEAPVVTCPAGQELTCFESVPAPFNNAADFIAAGGEIADNATADLADFIVFAQDSDNGGNNCPGNARIVTRTYFVQDDCGNTTNCTQTFTYLVSDQDPVITSVLPTCFKSCGEMANPLETDITYTTDCSFGATVNITGPTVIGQDNCPGTIYQYEYTVTDDCGRTSAPVTRDIIVENDGPTITCAPFNLILECGDPNNQDYIDQHIAQVTAETACDLGYNITHNPSSLNLISCGSSTVVTFTVTDACGRQANCTTTIAVQDNTAPTITSTYQEGVCDEIECSGDVTGWFNHWMNYVETHISATDACDTNVSWTTSNTQINQDCSNGEAVTWVTWFANDNCGNASEVTYYFKVLDSYGPEFTFVPGEETIDCAATPVFGTPTATDACGGVTFTFVDTEDTDNTCSGSYTRTWTAEDDCDNTSTASQTIFYEDTTGPVVSGGSDGTAECDGSGNVADVEAWVATNAGATAQDDCSEVASWSNDYDPANWVSTPACENGVVGYIDVAFTATDICGNAGPAQTYRFNVGDTTAPTFDDVPADGMIACNETPVFGTPMASDLCSNVTIDNGVDSQAGDSCNGSHTRTWTATDACGNTATASQTLTYSDTEGPVFTFVPADGESPCVDADGNITTYAQICSSSDDAEEDADTGEMDLASSDLELIIDESQDKEVVVGLRFKDLNIPAGANITAAWIQFTADATIDVDPSALEIHGEDSDNAATFTLEDDNITDRPTTSASVDWEPGDWDVIGDNLLAERTSDLSEIVQEIVDRGGYTAESALAFIIEGIGKRTAISWDGNPDQAPQLFVTYEAMDLFGDPTAEDVCDNGATFTHEDSFDNMDGCAGSMTRTWTATDDCGNTTTAAQTITFTDHVPPVFTFVPAHIEVACQDTSFPLQFGTPEAYDNCEDVTITHEDFWFLGDETTCDEDDEDSDYRRVWTATDACGNTTTAMQRYSLKDSYSLFGIIATEEGQTVEDVNVSLDGGFNGMTQMNQSGSNGQYGFFDLPLSQNYTVTPALDVDPLNGVSSFDLVLISQHILQTNLLDSPYKMIAADINRSGGISTMDLLELRKLILHIDEDFQNNTSWRFVESAFVFPQANNPFASIFPEEVYINGLTEEEQHDFVGVKVGDVNGSVIANVLAEAEDRTFVGDLAFDVTNQRLNAGQTYTVNFKANNFEAIHGYQFTLNFDQTALDFESVQAGDLNNMSENNFGLTLLNEGVITTSWTSEDAQSLVRGSDVFQVTFTAKANVQLSEVINVNSRYTKAEAYNGNLDLMNVTLRFDEGQVATSNTQLYQNTPNPFKSTTVIGFEFPEATSATLSIYDVSGRLLKQVEGDYAKGYNEVSVSKSDLQATGVVYYKLVTADFEKTMKMMIVK